MDFLIAFSLVLVHDDLLAPDQSQISAEILYRLVSAGDGTFDIFFAAVFGLRDGEFIENDDLFFGFKIFEIIKFMADFVENEIIGLICKGLFGRLGARSG